MKKTVSVYICDDDPVFSASFSALVRQSVGDARTCEISVFDNPVMLTDAWENAPADIVFLDIDMPMLSGFETAKYLLRSYADAVIIYVSGFDNYVFNAFEHDAFWFLRKSDLKQLGTAMAKALARVDAVYDRLERFVPLQIENCVVRIDISDVKVIEAKGHYIVLHLEKDEPQYYRCRISDAELQLQNNHFIRIANGILVNARFIGKVTSKTVTLTDGTDFNIGRGRVNAVKEQFAAYVRSLML